MALHQVKVVVDDLQVGMYVAALDRPWVETPFPLQGFFIAGPVDIESLRPWCRHVYVDVERGTAPRPRAPSSGPRAAPLKIHRNAYPARTTLRRELGKAADIPAQMDSALRQAWAELRRGRKTDLRATRRLVRTMVASVVRNPDALTWLAQLRRRDDYSYNHSLRASIWSTVFGRHLGLAVPALESLALGTVLSDVGMLRLGPELHRHTDAAELQQHVNFSLAMVQQSGAVDELATAVVATHHERFDGSGYPRGLQGDAIPYLGRIAAIAVHYDELINPPDAARAVTPAEAMSTLYGERGRAFQAEVVDEFIQALGIYPAGTLVELTSREVGVVVEQNPQRRLRPKVLLLTDAEHRLLRRRRTCDLAQLAERHGTDTAIARSLPPGWGGLDPLALCREMRVLRWCRWPLGAAGHPIVPDTVA